MIEHRSGRAVLLAAAVACAAVSHSVHAYTCYTLFDRNDNVVYRDTISPVDLSDHGLAGRQSLQHRGEYLMISEADRCPQVTFVFGNNGTTNLSTDEFLNGIRTNGTPRSGSITGSQSPRGAAATSPRTAPAAAMPSPVGSQ